jgi:hypothetical protein
MKRRAPALGSVELAAEILSLSKLDIDRLRERWKAIYGKRASREIGRSFLTRAISYRLQERAYGGLKPSTCRLLARAVEGPATGSSKRHQTRMAQSGTILIREWQGTAHRVTMLVDGVSFNGKRYQPDGTRLTDGPANFAPGWVSPNSWKSRRRRRSPGPCAIANRAHTRGFRSILWNVR